MVFPNDKIETKEFLKARNKFVDDFILTHYGPSWELEENQKIPFNPIHQYSSGVLFPRRIKINNDGSISDLEGQETPFDLSDEDDDDGEDAGGTSKSGNVDAADSDAGDAGESEDGTETAEE